MIVVWVFLGIIGVDLMFIGIIALIQNIQERRNTGEHSKIRR